MYTNVSGSSLKSPDLAQIINGAKKCVFLAFEVNAKIRQLTATKHRGNRDKSNHILCRFLSRFGFCLSFLPLKAFIVYAHATVISILLLAAGIEPNPGPDPIPVVDEEELSVLSQNCRGLTDRNKLIKFLKQLDVDKRQSKNTIACLQETHCIDQFATDNFYNGVVVLDNGERNQKGVGILVPEVFEVCQSRVSGVGRFAIAVIKSKKALASKKYVVANIYAPNCHREATVFFQDFLHVLDDVTDELNILDEDFESIITGDFNVVLDSDIGASNRIGSRAERDLAQMVSEAMSQRSLIEPSPLNQPKVYTWRRGTCLSKLDYVFLSVALQSKVKEAKIEWHRFGANYDHAAVRVKILLTQDSQRGRSFPKIYKSDITNEADKQWLSDQLRRVEQQIPGHWSPHLRLDFVKNMLRSKVLELRQMRKFTHSSSAIKEEINNIVTVAPLSSISADRLDELKLRLRELEEAEAEVLRIRAGVKWREEGEKSTAFFLSKFKARTAAATMRAVQVGARTIQGSLNILSIVRQFYRKLYNKEVPDRLNDEVFCNDFFDHCPTLEPELRASLSRPLDLAELRAALRTCSDSAPGMDGIPYSFYEVFSDSLLPYVLNSWEYALEMGQLADSHRRSCISLLPKKDKDLTMLGNWRPISLSSCDLKIITKAYADRLKAALPSVICEAQVAYVPGRDISFNNRLLKYAQSYATAQNEDCCVVSLDAQKAFDSVNHDYIGKVLEVYGFPPEFLEVFRTLYKDLESVVQVNGFLSPSFEVKNGVKQGDALSCGLFVLAIDPLVRNIMANPEIEGLSIPGGPREILELKVFSYADDVSVVCRNGSLQPIFSEYERFSRISGLTLNADKTEVFNLIRSPVDRTRIVYMGQSIELVRVEKIRICGCWLGRTPAQEYELNVLNRIEAMESMISSWGRRNLTLNGRMILAKTFVLSQIVFPAQMVKINKREIKRIEKLIYSFVNGARNLYGPERIARQNLKAPKALGGIDGIDVESFVSAIAIKQFGKAARNHRLLGELQMSLDPLVADEICTVVRESLRSNLRNYAAHYVIPDLQQISLISGIPLSQALRPNTRAIKVAEHEEMVTMLDIQRGAMGGRVSRAKINLILRSIPAAIANLIRNNSLVPATANTVWLTTSTISALEAQSSKSIRQSLLMSKYPNIGVNIEKIYKRADWPPPGIVFKESFANLWKIKNPALRAVRLKVTYKDVFSNERRHRFGLTNSAACEICSAIESVEHQLFACANANRMWSLFQRMTGASVASLLDVLLCTLEVEHEIVKSVLVKALIQIDRSKNITDRMLIVECVHYLKVEATVNISRATRIMQLVELLQNI